MRARWLLVGLWLVGCGPSDPCAGWHDALEGDDGLDLTADEHGPGWGQTECFQCHQAWNIHPVDCIDDSWIPFIDETTDVEDTLSCTACHGMNGTSSEDWVDTTSGTTGLF